ncbi:DMT family transporter [Frigidibacter sp. MR17.24]|uniref:DMT family transporter n=1 Tax=Frigidibacter sp. MR17.24 TaxID=3127345 RepID=UPI003012A115
MIPAATYAILVVAIFFEVVGTTLLQQSQQFTRLLPSIGVGLSYAASFWCLSIVLKTLPVGVTYAIWSGLGIVLLSIIGYVVFRQRLDTAALVGLGFIVTGILIVNLFSKAAPH